MQDLVDFRNRYGPWAIVTGASSGIGTEFARQLALVGLSVVLVARRKDRLEALASEIGENYPVKTRIVVADLATEKGRKDVMIAVSELDVGLLVNNAGVEAYGSFLRDTEETHVNLIDVNVTAVTVLAHGIGGKLVKRGKGGIIFVASLASYLFPWFATYSASKAFVRGLSLTLRHEFGPKGVDVLSLEPGVVTSELSARITDEINLPKAGFQVMRPEKCVSIALRSLQAKQASVIPGLMNKIMLFLLELLPKHLALKISGFAIEKVMKPELMIQPA